MVIGIFYNSAWYIYNFRKNLIQELQRAGHTVIAISPVDDFVEKLEALGVKHYAIDLDPLNVNPLKEMKTIVELGRLLRKVRPDSLLSFTVKCNLYAGLCAFFCSFKQIANVSGLGQVFDRKDILNRIVCTLYRLALRRVSCVFFQNKEDMELCVTRRLVPRGRAYLLPGSGVDLRYFSPVGSTNVPKRTFLMFGRLLPKKGYDLFLESAKILKKQYGERVEFQVMGVLDEKRDASLELYNQVKQADKEGFVTLIPRKSDVRPILQSADVVVLPSSYNEGIPRSLLEALACGKPIITTHWKGCRETVVHERSGYLIPVGDVAALTRVLEQMILLPAEQLEAMGHAGRQIAEERFDERLVISQYLRQVASAA